jgi:tetratricopeptide (TPR) repeat protein
MKTFQRVALALFIACLCKSVTAENTAGRNGSASEERPNTLRPIPAGMGDLLGLEITNRASAEIEIAISNLTDRIRISPNDAGLFGRRALYYLSKNKIDKAMSDVNTAIALDSTDGAAFFTRALIYIEKADFENIVRDLDLALQHIPREVLVSNRVAHANLYHMRGIAHRKRGDLDKAIEDLSRAILIDPKNYVIHYDRAIAYSRNNQDERAISDLTEVIRLNPKIPDAYSSRGKLYYDKGQVQKAIKEYTEAVRLSADNVEIYLSRAVAFREIKDWDNAIADYSQVIKRSPTNCGAYFTRGVAYGEAGKYEKAIDDFTKAMELGYNQGIALCNRALAWEDRGQWQKAVADYTEAIRSDSTMEDAYNQLAWLYATCPESSVRNGGEAVRIAKQACEMTQWTNSSFVGTLAAAYAEAADFDNAVRLQKKVLSMNDLSETEKKEEEERLKLFLQQKPYREHPEK